jgi:hypothetical protein
MFPAVGFGGPFKLSIAQAALRFGLPRPPALPAMLAISLRRSGDIFAIRAFAVLFAISLNHFETSAGTFFFT